MREDPYDAVTGLDESHAEASPNDPDLGEQAILKRQEYYEPFGVSITAPFFYTSNVALVREGEEDDIIFAPAVIVSYAPKLARTLYGSFSLGQQQLYYNEFGEFDFGSFDARAGLSYTVPQWQNLLLRAEYNYNRLTSSGPFDDEFFSSHALFFSAEVPYRIGRAQQISVGTGANLSLHAEPDAPRRHDFDVYVGYVVRLTRALTASAVARMAVRDYVDSSRTDVSEILAVNASYAFTKWLSASATSTLAASQSNRSAFDYEVANVGGAVALNFRF